MSNRITEADLTNELASGDAPLGAIVFWRSLDNVKVSRAAHRAMFERAGLDGALSKDPKPEACLNRAAAFASLATSQGLTKGQRAPVRVEMKDKNPTDAIYSVLVRDDLSDGRVRYLEEARITCPRWQRAPALQVAINPKATRSSHAPDRDRVIDTAVERYDELLNFVFGTELSQAMIRAMSIMGALTLRTGVYFVPAQSLAQLAELRSELGTVANVHVSYWEISRTRGNVDEARTDAKLAMLDRLAAIKFETEAMIGAASSADDLSAKSVNARVRHLDELEADATLYAEILGDYSREIAEQIAQARSRIELAVDGLFEVPE